MQNSNMRNLSLNSSDLNTLDASEQSQSNAIQISRRAMLATSSAAMMTLATGNIFAEEPNKKKGFIDAHVHVWTPDTKKYPLSSKYKVADMKPASFTPDQLMAHAEPNKVSRVVLIQMSFYGTDNSYMLDTMKKYPGTYSGVAVIDENSNPAKVMKELKTHGVRGFRIVAGKQDPNTWLKTEGMKTMWKTAADEGMAICPLMNPHHIPAVYEMCKNYPDTRVVVDHFARIGVTGEIKPDELNELCKLAEHKNTYVKTSAFYALGKKSAPYTDLGPMIQQCKDTFGSERLMWATDCPYQVDGDHTYKASINLIKNKLPFLTKSDKKWMLKKTAEKVFFS